MVFRDEAVVLMVAAGQPFYNEGSFRFFFLFGLFVGEPWTAEGLARRGNIAVRLICTSKAGISFGFATICLLALVQCGQVQRVGGRT